MGLSAKKIFMTCWLHLVGFTFISSKFSSLTVFIPFICLMIFWIHYCHEKISGQEPTDAYLEAMIGEAAGPINFTMFLTMFGEKLNGRSSGFYGLS